MSTEMGVRKRRMESLRGGIRVMVGRLAPLTATSGKILVNVRKIGPLWLGTSKNGRASALPASSYCAAMDETASLYGASLYRTCTRLRRSCSSSTSRMASLWRPCDFSRTLGPKAQPAPAVTRQTPHANATIMLTRRRPRTATSKSGSCRQPKKAPRRFAKVSVAFRSANDGFSAKLFSCSSQVNNLTGFRPFRRAAINRKGIVCTRQEEAAGSLPRRNRPARLRVVFWAWKRYRGVAGSSRRTF